MTENSTEQHYKKFLARHYSWMFGDFDQQVEKNLSWFKSQGVHPQSDLKAIDLGCGSGFQSIALSLLGFDVTAVDFNQQLLDELKSHDEKDTVKVIQSDILKPENFSGNGPYELAICMGDTLSHLPSIQSVAKFLKNTHNLLEPGGNLILSFRDYSIELTGVDRFIPVQEDQDKIMTVFLEYEPDHVFVHDLIYEREDIGWKFEKSVYKKVRLNTDKIITLLENANFSVNHLTSDHGMVHIVAMKP